MASLSQRTTNPAAETVTVVCLVRHKPFRPLPRTPPPPPYPHPFQSLLGQLHLDPAGPEDEREPRSHPPPASASSPCPPRSTRPLPPLFCRDEAAVEERPRPQKLAFLIQAREEHLPDPCPYPLLLPPPQPPPCHYIPRTSAASPSTHNRCATHTGSRSSCHRPEDGRFGRAEAKAAGSFPTVHPSAHSLAPPCLKISHTGFETTSEVLQ